MKCSQCGVDLSAFDVVCPACGTPQQQAQAAPAPAAPTPASYDDALPPIRSRQRSVGSLAMWIVIVLVFIVAGGMYEATQKTVAAIGSANLMGDQAARIQQLQQGEAECDAMLGMVNQASQQMNATDFKDALGTAMEGLTHEDGCTYDSKPAFAGILMSIKAVSEHFLDRGDATDDMNAANLLLQQCQAETRPDDAANVRNCTNWLGTNRMYLQQWSDAQP